MFLVSMLIGMNGDLLLLVFVHAQPDLWLGEWFMNSY